MLRVIEPVKWDTSVKKENDSIYTIYFQAKISGEWHLYSQFSDPKSGAAHKSYGIYSYFNVFIFNSKILHIKLLEMFKK